MDCDLMDRDWSIYVCDRKGMAHTTTVGGARALVDKGTTEACAIRTESPDCMIDNQSVCWLHREHVV